MQLNNLLANKTLLENLSMKDIDKNAHPYFSLKHGTITVSRNTIDRTVDVEKLGDLNDNQFLMLTLQVDAKDIEIIKELISDASFYDKHIFLRGIRKFEASASKVSAEALVNIFSNIKKITKDMGKSNLTASGEMLLKHIIVALLKKLKILNSVPNFGSVWTNLEKIPSAERFFVLAAKSISSSREMAIKEFAHFEVSDGMWRAEAVNISIVLGVALGVILERSFDHSREISYVINAIATMVVKPHSIPGVILGIKQLSKLTANYNVVDYALNNAKKFMEPGEVIDNVEELTRYVSALVEVIEKPIIFETIPLSLLQSAVRDKIFIKKENKQMMVRIYGTNLPTLPENAMTAFRLSHYNAHFDYVANVTRVSNKLDAHLKAIKVLIGTNVFDKLDSLHSVIDVDTKDVMYIDFDQDLLLNPYIWSSNADIILTEDPSLYGENTTNYTKRTICGLNYYVLLRFTAASSILDTTNITGYHSGGNQIITADHKIFLKYRESTSDAYGSNIFSSANSIFSRLFAKVEEVHTPDESASIAAQILSDKKKTGLLFGSTLSNKLLIPKNELENFLSEVTEVVGIFGKDDNRNKKGRKKKSFTFSVKSYKNSENYGEQKGLIDYKVSDITSITNIFVSKHDTDEGVKIFKDPALTFCGHAIVSSIETLVKLINETSNMQLFDKNDKDYLSLENLKTCVAASPLLQEHIKSLLIAAVGTREMQVFMENIFLSVFNQMQAAHKANNIICTAYNVDINEQIIPLILQFVLGLDDDFKIKAANLIKALPYYIKESIMRPVISGRLI